MYFNLSIIHISVSTYPSTASVYSKRFCIAYPLIFPLKEIYRIRPIIATEHIIWEKFKKEK